jgi:hypothetical protein
LIVPRRVRGRLAAFLLGAAAALSLAACSATDDVAVLETTLVTWPGAEGSTAGQVIVSVRNDAERPVDPDVLGSGRLTLAHLLDPDGEDLPGGDARVQLHAVPHILDPGEAGYLIGEFEIGEPAERVADARVELNAAATEARVPVSVEGFELVEDADGIGARGHLEWNGSGTAVARAIALDTEGRALGYLATSEVLYSAGDFTMCCFPPTVDRDEIDQVVTFGDQAIEEN